MNDHLQTLVGVTTKKPQRLLSLIPLTGRQVIAERITSSGIELRQITPDADGVGHDLDIVVLDSGALAQLFHWLETIEFDVPLAHDL